MARSHVEIGEAGLSDMPDVARMWGTLRTAAGRFGRMLPEPTQAAIEQLRARIAGDHDARLVVARIDGAVVGMAYFVYQPMLPLISAVASVRVMYVHVQEAFRRQGVGHALLNAAVGFADSRGADHIVVDVHPASRESNRFFARLGLMPLVTARTAPVAVLRRRLMPQLALATADTAQFYRSAKAAFALAGRRR